MLEFQLAPCIIAGLLVATGYMFNRWLSNLGELGQWKALAVNLQDNVDGMRAEGCAALRALQNIFNGATASGVPISPTLRRVADTAAKTLFEAPGCDHKARADAWEQIARDFEACCDEAEAKAEGLFLGYQRTIGERNTAQRRAEEAERLLGLVQDRLVVERSKGRIL